jgi:hypothetical protein
MFSNTRTLQRSHTQRFIRWGKGYILGAISIRHTSSFQSSPFNLDNFATLIHIRHELIVVKWHNLPSKYLITFWYGRCRTKLASHRLVSINYCCFLARYLWYDRKMYIKTNAAWTLNSKQHWETKLRSINYMLVNYMSAKIEITIYLHSKML